MLPLREFVIVLLMFLGVALIVIAAVGLVRMPDLFLRNSVSSKGATLGVASLMLAAAFYFDDLGITSLAIAIIIFMMLTAPVAAHVLGRAGYKNGAPFWAKTTLDANIDYPPMERHRVEEEADV